MSSGPNVALVTGAAKRVGRAIALELALAGHDVAVHFRSDPAAADEVVSRVEALGRRAIGVRGELTDPVSWPELVRQTVEQLGALDVLVNNASMFLTANPDSIEQFDPAVWDVMWKTNVLAPMGLSHHAREPLAQRGQGCIVNLCDISSGRPWPSHLAYCTSKAALAALTQGLARALAPDIRVNGVAPGIAVFPDSYSAELRRRLTAQVPLAREGTPESIARAVRFLVESADYVTGQIIAVDGGRSIC